VTPGADRWRFAGFASRSDRLRIEKEVEMPGMGGMMASMWIWMLVGVLLIVFLVIAVLKLLNKK